MSRPARPRDTPAVGFGAGGHLVPAEPDSYCRICGDPAAWCDLHPDSDDDAFYCHAHRSTAQDWRRTTR